MDANVTIYPDSNVDFKQLSPLKMQCPVTDILTHHSLDINATTSRSSKQQAMNRDLTLAEAMEMAERFRV